MLHLPLLGLLARKGMSSGRNTLAINIGRILLKKHAGQDAVVWNAVYVVKGWQAIFGAMHLWCALNHIEIEINRIGAPLPETGLCLSN